MLNGVSESREQLVHTLNGVLECDNSLSRCRAVRALADIGAREQTSCNLLLSTLAGDPDADVRTEAAVALGRIGGVEATRPLLDCVGGDPDGDVRIQAVIALAHLHDPQAVEPLIQCIEEDGYPQLDDPADDLEYGACWEVHSQALLALGALGDPRAVDTVVGLLENSEYEDLHDTCFEVLARLDDARSRSFLLQHLHAESPLDRRRAARAFAAVLKSEAEITDASAGIRVAEIQKALTTALLDSVPDVRIEAVRALSASPDPMAMVSITLLLGDPELQVRKEVVSLLGASQGREIVSRLHSLLPESNTEFKSHVVRVLGSIAAPASQQPLAEMLATQDPELLYEVVLALGHIAQPGAEAAIAAIVADQEQSAGLRAQAATALGRIIAAAATSKGDGAESSVLELSDPEAILHTAAADENDQVCLAALTALVDINPMDAASVLSEIVTANITTMREAADETDTPTVPAASEDVPVEFESHLSDASPETSTLAAILATAVDPEPEPEPEPVSDVPETTEQQHTPVACLVATRLLGGLANPGSAALAALMHAAQAVLPDLRREALLALGRLGEEQALELFRAALKDQNREVRVAALDGLACFGPRPAAADWLEALIQDPDPIVREHAVKTLVTVAAQNVDAHLARALGDDNLAVCRAALRALSNTGYGEQARQAIIAIMFKFSGELRQEAAATLRRLNDFQSADGLLAMLRDPDHEDYHWICIDALAQMYASDTSVTVTH